MSSGLVQKNASRALFLKFILTHYQDVTTRYYGVIAAVVEE
jgi:hypothetical protein